MVSNLKARFSLMCMRRGSQKSRSDLPIPPLIIDRESSDMQIELSDIEGDVQDIGVGSGRSTASLARQEDEGSSDVNDMSNFPELPPLVGDDESSINLDDPLAAFGAIDRPDINVHHLPDLPDAADEGNGRPALAPPSDGNMQDDTASNNSENLQQTPSLDLDEDSEQASSASAAWKTLASTSFTKMKAAKFGRVDV